MDALEALRTRRSVRVYADRPVARELVESIVDCGRLAATVRNEQPVKRSLEEVLHWERF